MPQHTTRSVSDDGWPASATFRAETARTGAYRLEANPPAAFTPWRTRIGSTRRDIWSSPAVAYGMVFCGCGDGYVYALDALTGTVCWRKQASGPRANVSASPAVAQHVVYIGSMDGGMYALDARTGALRWQRQLDAPLNASPAVVNGRVVITAGQHVHALEAHTGVPVWYARVGETDTSPAVMGTTVYVASQADVYALDVATGRVRWHYETEGWGHGLQLPSGLALHSTPAVAHGLVYVGGFQGFYALDAETGGLRWQYRADAAFYAAPAVQRGVVFCAAMEDGRLFALDAITGGALWTCAMHARIMSGLTVAEDLLYLLTDAGTIAAVGTTTGHRHWQVQTGGRFHCSPTIARGILYVTNRNGTVYAFNARTGNDPQTMRMGATPLWRALRPVGHVVASLTQYMSAPWRLARQRRLPPPTAGEPARATRIEADLRVVYHLLGIPHEIVTDETLETLLLLCFTQVFSRGGMAFGHDPYVARTHRTHIKLFGHTSLADGHVVQQLTAWRDGMEPCPEPDAFERVQCWFAQRLAAQLTQGEVQLTRALERLHPTAQIDGDTLIFGNGWRERLDRPIQTVLEYEPGIQGLFLIRQQSTLMRRGSRAPVFSYWTISRDPFLAEFLPSYFLAYTQAHTDGQEEGRRALEQRLYHGMRGRLDVMTAESIRDTQQHGQCSGMHDVIIAASPQIARTDVAELDQALRQSYRMLRPGGALLLGAPVAPSTGSHQTLPELVNMATLSLAKEGVLMLFKVHLGMDFPYAYAYGVKEG
jgi:outer membrane protein assembly factor BamB